MAKKIADRAIQVLGGNGYVAEYKVRRVTVLRIESWVLRGWTLLDFEASFLKNAYKHKTRTYINARAHTHAHTHTNSHEGPAPSLFSSLSSTFYVYVSGGEIVEGQQALGNRGRNERGPSQEHDERHQESWLQNPIMPAVGAQSLRLTEGLMANIDDAFSGAGKIAGPPQYPRYNVYI
jgi:hypothetical protein